MKEETVAKLIVFVALAYFGAHLLTKGNGVPARNAAHQEAKLELPKPVSFDYRMQDGQFVRVVKEAK